MSITATRERPILFSAEMVRAILAGTQTQTRRIVKPQPPAAVTRADVIKWPNNTGSAVLWLGDGPIDPLNGMDYKQRNQRGWVCPYGMPGGRLWVRETFTFEHWNREFGDEPPLPKDRPWKHLPAISHEDCDHWLWPHYRATDPTPDLCCERDNCRTCENNGSGPHWQPSIHMPRWASRITLAITDIRVQRLHEIGGADILAEGVDNGKSNPAMGARWENMQRMAFEDLWLSINGAGSWNANPFVWVISFERVHA